MKKHLHITASIDQPDLMENVVEKLAERHIDIGFAKTPAIGEWQAVDTSSIEKYITGVLVADFENEEIRVPFISSFIFSCTKHQSDSYKLNWSMSLS